MTTVYDTLYKKLTKHLKLDLASLKPGDHQKVSRPGFMDLNLDVLSVTQEHAHFALSHYYKHPSGDMIADPDMEFIFHKQSNTVECISYQDLFGYRVVYPDGFGTSRVDIKAKKELNAFAEYWFGNLNAQGFRFDQPEPA